MSLGSPNDRRASRCRTDRAAVRGRCVPRIDAGSGFDLTLSDNRSDRPEGSYDAWYASVGHGFGPRLYLSMDYATSLAIVHVLDGGTVIERRPESKRYGMSSVWNMTRRFSLTLALEQLRDDTSADDRGTCGLVVRF